MLSRLSCSGLQAFRGRLSRRSFCIIPPRCVMWESPPTLLLPSIFERDTLYGHLCAAISIGKGGEGLRGGGVAGLPAFNRDALTNRLRISLLDKASFILTLHIPQKTVWRWRGRWVYIFLGVGGSTDGILYLDVLCLIMPDPSAWTHTHNTQSHSHITPGWIFPQAPSLETALHISHINHTLCQNGIKMKEDLETHLTFFAAFKVQKITQICCEHCLTYIGWENNCTIQLFRRNITYWMRMTYFKDLCPFLQSTCNQTCTCTHHTESDWVQHAVNGLCMCVWEWAVGLYIVVCKWSGETWLGPSCAA